MILKIISAIVAARDIVKYAIQLWEVVQKMRRDDELRKQAQAAAQRLKDAKTAEEVERAARDHLGGL